MIVISRLVFTLYRWFEMHGRLLNEKDLAQNAIQPETLGNGLLFAVFLVQTLTLTQIQVKYISFPCLFDENNFPGFKIGIFLSRPKLRRDSGFSGKIGIIPTKSGWLDILTVLHFTLKYEQYACPQTPPHC